MEQYFVVPLIDPSKTQELKNIQSYDVKQLSLDINSLIAQKRLALEPAPIPSSLAQAGSSSSRYVAGGGVSPSLLGKVLPPHAPLRAPGRGKGQDSHEAPPYFGSIEPNLAGGDGASSVPLDQVPHLRNPSEARDRSPGQTSPQAHHQSRRTGSNTAVAGGGEGRSRSPRITSRDSTTRYRDQIEQNRNTENIMVDNDTYQLETDGGNPKYAQATLSWSGVQNRNESTTVEKQDPAVQQQICNDIMHMIGSVLAKGGPAHISSIDPFVLNFADHYLRELKNHDPSIDYSLSSPVAPKAYTAELRKFNGYILEYNQMLKHGTDVITWKSERETAILQQRAAEEESEPHLDSGVGRTPKHSGRF